MKTIVLAFAALFFTLSAMSQNTTKLPAPRKTGGMPLMEALSKRASNRALDAKKSLTEQQLSDLLWAAWGVNRPDGRRTAASALNRQEVDLYLIGRKAAYSYDAGNHELREVAVGDFRSKVSGQEFTRAGDWIVIFVADYRKMGGDAQSNAVTAGIDAGLIAQNIYLYAASEGLGTVVHMTVDRPEVARILKLSSDQHIVMGQTVGCPAE